MFVVISSLPSPLGLQKVLFLYSLVVIYKLARAAEERPLSRRADFHLGYSSLVGTFNGTGAGQSLDLPSYGGLKFFVTIEDFSVDVQEKCMLTSFEPLYSFFTLHDSRKYESEDEKDKEI